MIRLENVGKRYGDTDAVANLNLDVEKGDLVVLIGPSGCGKTTTLKMINHLIEPSSGSIYLDGRNTAEIPVEQLRRGIGYVIQSIGLFPHMSVTENIQVVPRLLGWSRRQRRDRAREMLELVGLDPDRYADSYPNELSGGQQQRVGVARALAVDPPVLLMDEPFGAVDPLRREHLQDEFLALQQSLHKTIVMVTHDIDEAIRLADKVCVMNAGRIEQYAPVDTLLRMPRNTFVRRFIGSDRVVKRLSQLPVGSLLQQLTHADGHDHYGASARSDTASSTGSPLTQTIGSNESAYDALVCMLSTDVCSLTVLDAQDQALGVIELKRIMEWSAGN